MSATPVAREGARRLAHDLYERFIRPEMQKRGATWWCDGMAWDAVVPAGHGTDCDRLSKAIEADRASRDASAVEVERTMREALESARTFMESDDCVAVNGPGWNARRAAIIDIGRALARVASLRGGTNHG